MDTDMALDDARALILLCQDPSIEIAAVVTVDGSASPVRGAKNALAVMRALGKTDVLVGAGVERAALPPPWRSMSETLGGVEPSLPSGDSIMVARDVLTRVCSEHPEGVAYVCLGPLTNLAELLTSHPLLAGSVVRRVYIQGDSGPLRWTSWNTQRDTLAARAVFSSKLPVYSCVLADSVYLRFDDSLLAEIETCSTTASHFMTRMHRHPSVQDLMQEGHFRCWDETVALALTDPSLARFDPEEGRPGWYALAHWDALGARRLYVELLSGKYKPVDWAPVAFLVDLTDSSLYREDIRAIAGNVIGRYGSEEWRAVVLTTELHGHLGIYSIIGAKMGIRALELMAVHAGDVLVESAAGLEPPLSCLNDGLQVATGATLGQGTISILPGGAAPSASVAHGIRRLHLELKAPIAEEISDALGQLLQRCGGLTPEYWMRVRQLAIQYWRDLDRSRAFHETWE